MIGAGFADFDEGDLENFGAQITQPGRECTGLMAGAAYQDAKAG
jgi:hypothetical protein